MIQGTYINYPKVMMDLIQHNNNIITNDGGYFGKWLQFLLQGESVMSIQAKILIYVYSNGVPNFVF